MTINEAVSGFEVENNENSLTLFPPAFIMGYIYFVGCDRNSGINSGLLNKLRHLWQNNRQNLWVFESVVAGGNYFLFRFACLFSICVGRQIRK